MSTPGYYRYPTICENDIVFVCEDDLWTVSVEGGVARRLTSGLAEVSSPCFSPDGQHIAFTGRDEGPAEVYVAAATGGPSRRLTYLGAIGTQVAAWDAQQRIVFASNAGQPFLKLSKLWAIDLNGGMPEQLPYGPANNIAFGPQGRIVLGRHTRDPARWKRYRGGTCGYIWIDARGSGKFRRLIDLDGNLASPMCVGDRIYFLSDHEGVGNLYSCRGSGKDLRRHTDHQDFYVRNASTDGTQVVYHCGGDLFVHDVASDRSSRVDVEFHGPRTQRNRKFVSAAKYLESYDPHPKGGSAALVCRGKAFSMGNWEGPVVQHGQPDGVRCRLAAWLCDGKRLVAVGDESGDESLIVFHADASAAPRRLPRMDVGRAVEMVASPAEDKVVLHNHRGELIVVNLATEKKKLLDTSQHGQLGGIDISPDGQWVAYSINNSAKTSIIRLRRLSGGKAHDVTRAVLADVAPAFDPDGKYLYFLSHRVFDPVYDNMHFDLGFPRGMRPYLVTLRKDLPSPFRCTTALPAASTDANGQASAQSNGSETEEATPPLTIDLDGIENRVVAFPVAEGKYQQVCGLPGGKVLFSSVPVEGSLDRNWYDAAPPAKAKLERYDLSTQKLETWLEGITDFGVSADGKKIVVRSADQLRWIDAAEKPKQESTEKSPGRESGWLDLKRVRVSVSPPDEWRQMYLEAWRLLRDHFWTEDMSGVAWKKIRDLYLPLVDRIASRAEFSDLMWEMQGELGTSHAYEIGGDYRARPRYKQGFLGADFRYDAKRGGYVVTHLVEGDVWEEGSASPLHSPGVNVAAGDVVVAIGGRELDERTTPHELLVHQADSDVLLTVVHGRQEPRKITVRTLDDDTPARYREWVEGNRRYVHEKTGGRVGYVHLPNMGPIGFAEFHRYYLVESERDALVVDVRFNGGGHVSQLILEKLIRRRIGYDIPRWGVPEPYPADSVLGPIVALTNELAGSDGDIFSHCFKLLKIGPLIGKRTWGGVIGIWPRHPLVDGSVTTQPEFSFWFEDVGWGVENYGTDPDIDVDITPHDDAAGRDAQLDRAISEVQRLLRASRLRRPTFDKRPNLAPPILPERSG